MKRPSPLPTGLEHLSLLQETLSSLQAEAGRIESWARHLARR